MKTINITPTWIGCLPILIEATRNGTTEGQRMAREEFERMARTLDELNSRDRVTNDKPKRLAIILEHGGIVGVVSDHADIVGLDYTTIDRDVEGVEESRCVIVGGREAYCRDHKVKAAAFPICPAADYAPATTENEADETAAAGPDGDGERGPITSDIGLMIRDAIEGREFVKHDLGGDEVREVGSGTIDNVDASDANNLRVMTGDGAIFVVRIFREG